jgi:phosphoribosylanthranilate isomerase
MRPRLKVCCIASPEEARRAIAAGADAVGLVGEMPSGPGPIADTLAAEIVRCVPPPVATFLLTSQSTADAIADHVLRVGAGTVQIVRHIDPGEYALLRRRLPMTKLVQVVHVESEATLALATAYGELADALLLDSGRPGAAIAELGGTGRVHDWGISERLVASARVPVFLAGGLNSGNVGAAVRHVRPFGIDVCSGVRTGGPGSVLDDAKLAAFVRALWP